MRGRRVAAICALFVLLGWGGNASVVAYERFDYDFGSKVDLGRLAIDIMSVAPVDVVGAFFSFTGIGLVNLAMVVTLIAVVGIEITRPRHRVGMLATVAAFGAPLGLVALLVLAETIRFGPDGEWLAEGWPILEVFAIWSLALAVYPVAVAREAQTVSSDRG